MRAAFGLYVYCLSPPHVQAVFPLYRVLHVFPGRWRQLSEVVSSAWLLGPLKVERAKEKVEQAGPSCRALGNSSDPQALVSGAQSIWQEQKQDTCIPTWVKATTGGAWLQCPPLCWTLRWLGLQVVPFHGPLVVAGHAHAWSLRWLWLFAPAACRACKRCPVTLSLPRRHPTSLNPCQRCLTACILNQSHPALWEAFHVQRKILRRHSHPTFSFHPLPQWCFASPEGLHLLLGSLGCGAQLPSPWCTTQLASQVVST